MSGAISGILGPIGFVKSIVTSILAPSLRYIVWPATSTVTAPSGAGPSILNSLTSGGGATSASGAPGLTGYIPIIEEHRDELIITEHPVEQGATITDHAFKMPAMLTMRIGWSTSMPANNPNSLGNLTGVSALSALPLPTFAGFWSTSSDAAINSIYQTLQMLQVTRTLLTIATARRLYQNMLLQGLTLENDEKTEHALLVTCVLKEVILVSTQVVAAPVNATANALPGSQNPTQPQGGQQTSPSGLEGNTFTPPTTPPPASGGPTITPG